MGTGCCCFRVPLSGVTPAHLENIRGDPPSRRCLPPASCDQNETFSRSHLCASYPTSGEVLSHRSRFLRPEGECGSSDGRIEFDRGSRVQRECARARARTPLTSDSSRIVFSQGIAGVPSCDINRLRGKNGRQERERLVARAKENIFFPSFLLCLSVYALPAINP